MPLVFVFPCRVFLLPLLVRLALMFLLSEEGLAVHFPFVSVFLSFWGLSFPPLRFEE